MDVRDAMKAGKRTVVVPTGGVEPNGPWLALGKHNYVLQSNCDAIARKLGNALGAPIVKFVPEGAREQGQERRDRTINRRPATSRHAAGLSKPQAPSPGCVSTGSAPACTGRRPARRCSPPGPS